jgi:hypothetical protein
MSIRRKLKHAWEAVACWLPEWTVRWYWRREVKLQFERMRCWADDPANVAKLNALPPAYIAHRATRHIHGVGDPCEVCR